LLESEERGIRPLSFSRVERHHYESSQRGEQALPIYTLEKAYSFHSEPFSDFRMLSEAPSPLPIEAVPNYVQIAF
jgi:hypothetical protein